MTFEELCAQAKELEESLTPEARKAMKREQYISFVHGNGNWSNPHRMTREEVTAWVDELIASGEIVL